ncbi:hypothetical protein MXB_1779 [Myxobolus squamalis]|nr:hypothetical protein MXB_1779 [Myxobolus squamalis]
MNLFQGVLEKTFLIV